MNAGWCPHPDPLPREEGLDWFPLPLGEGQGEGKTEPGLTPGFFTQKKMRTTGSAKVHVGFIFSSFERNSLTGGDVKGQTRTASSLWCIIQQNA